MDLIILGSAVGSTYIYGIAKYERGDLISGADGSYYAPGKLTILQGNGKSFGPIETGYVVTTGECIGITVTGTGSNQHIASLVRLTALKDVPNSAWSGSGAVTVGGPDVYRALRCAVLQCPHSGLDDAEPGPRLRGLFGSLRPQRRGPDYPGALSAIDPAGKDKNTGSPPQSAAGFPCFVIHPLRR